MRQFNYEITVSGRPTVYPRRRGLLSTQAAVRITRISLTGKVHLREAIHLRACSDHALGRACTGEMLSFLNHITLHMFDIQ
jgi:hypothetical protein